MRRDRTGECDEEVEKGCEKSHVSIFVFFVTLDRRVFAGVKLFPGGFFFLVFLSFEYICDAWTGLSRTLFGRFCILYSWAGGSNG